jgi:hypothetical protein
MTRTALPNLRAGSLPEAIRRCTVRSLIRRYWAISPTSYNFGSELFMRVFPSECPRLRDRRFGAADNPHRLGAVCSSRRGLVKPVTLHFRPIEASCA